MVKGKLLIIDDNVQILESLKILLNGEFNILETLRKPDLIPEKLQHQSFDIILMDMNFEIGETSGQEGMYWLKKIIKNDPLAIVILITAFGDIELTVEAMKLGATDFITKPWNPDKLIATLNSGYELRKSRLENRNLRDKQLQLTSEIDKNFSMFTGLTVDMKRILETVNKVAGTDANILILGENGTGKEVIAREIHRQSDRAEEVFISVDLAALSESLFESEMFGHVKGAFTDAREDRAGRFEVANGGTLFLDEIGNLSLSIQSKLLQVLQNREVIRVGATQPVPVDIRLISATNKPIHQMVSEQTFREDLFFRINTIKIEIPPLRERIPDIPGLTDFFLKEYTRKYEKPFLKINSKAMDKLCSYTWPGNVRELKHTMEKSVILCESSTIKPEDLNLSAGISTNKTGKITYKLSNMEKNTITRVIKECRGNYSKAAKMLGISRTTLYAKIKKYGL
ncbi:MAG: sigma-54-dependent Fis family transcriptional regulator [Bacteroidales bacterium]|nr:sigma-54-dependent Fis family transcriptional regulator [Bacteroidales bacterium]